MVPPCWSTFNRIPSIDQRIRVLDYDGATSPTRDRTAAFWKAPPADLMNFMSFIEPSLRAATTATGVILLATLSLQLSSAAKAGNSIGVMVNAVIWAGDNRVNGFRSRSDFL